MFNFKKKLRRGERDKYHFNQERSEKIKEQQLIELSVSISLSEGMVKLVHIDSGNYVKTIAECTPQTCTDGFIQCDIPLDEGLNRLKLVGYGCKDVKLNIVFPKGFKYC